MNECKRNISGVERSLNSLSYLTNVFLCLLLCSLLFSRKTRSTHWHLISRTPSCQDFLVTKTESSHSLSVCCGSNRSRQLSVRQKRRRNICRLVALLPRSIWRRDSRLTFHLIWLLSSSPSLWSSSSRITCSFWIWAALVKAISFTGRWTLKSPAANKNKKHHQQQITSWSAA